MAADERAGRGPLRCWPELFGLCVGLNADRASPEPPPLPWSLFAEYEVSAFDFLAKGLPPPLPPAVRLASAAAATVTAAVSAVAVSTVAVASATRRATVLRAEVVAGQRLLVQVHVVNIGQFANGSDFQLSAELALDRPQVAHLGASAHRDGEARRPCSCCATDPVHVRFRRVGQVEVHDVRDVVNVDAAGGDVGRDQDVCPAGFETVERTRACVLGLVPVDRAGVDAALGELLDDAVCAVLGAAEDKRSAGCFGFEEDFESAGLKALRMW